MPEKNALDHVASLIAILESQRSQYPPRSDNVTRFRSKRPRILVNDNEKKAILDWLQRYFAQQNNQPAGFRHLTAVMLADGQVFVVSGLVMRNKMFSGKNGLWHLAEFAA